MTMNGSAPLERFYEVGWEQAAARAAAPIRDALEKALAAGDSGGLTREECLRLAACGGDDLIAVLAAADRLRRQIAGDWVTYVVNRNINFTNVCFVGCKFCASGLEGLKRNLSSGEIVAQILNVCRLEDEHAPDKAAAGLASFDNIVVMGMGEPMANYEALMDALRTLNADWGLNFGARRVTLSTSGVVPKILKLADEPLGFRLAISLHGATNAVSKGMRVTTAMPSAMLNAALELLARRAGSSVGNEA